MVIISIAGALLSSEDARVMCLAIVNGKSLKITKEFNRIGKLLITPVINPISKNKIPVTSAVLAIVKQ